MSVTREDRLILIDAAAIIEEALTRGEVVRIPGFGKFEVGKVTTRTGFNSGPSVIKTVPKFKPFSRLKDAVVSIREAPAKEFGG
jgi:nucleoid DNA-binding protein